MLALHKWVPFSYYSPVKYPDKNENKEEIKEIMIQTPYSGLG